MGGALQVKDQSHTWPQEVIVFRQTLPPGVNQGKLQICSSQEVERLWR